MTKEQYDNLFVGKHLDAGRLELMRIAIENGKKRGYKLSGYRRLKKRQLSAIVRNEKKDLTS